MAVQKIPLDRLYFVPAFQAPLKTHSPVASADQRLAMLNLITRDIPEWDIWTYEIDARRLVPTIESVEEMLQQEPEAELYLIIGGDQAAQFQQWRDWERLLQLVQVVCFGREAGPVESRLSERLIMIPYHAPVSSTFVREQSQAGASITAWVPAAVAEYIRMHGLYQ